ncbi:leucine-rich repeat domain-containing protein [Actinosynnema sp. NPDC020468]|uniref:leucine-rich repeat domain-containing protein n=1 Tax=Actinosynnema sp. NPDC020468 TaxID=3154488 RepID=UPI0033F61A14
MSTDENAPQVFHNRFAGAVGPTSADIGRDLCQCLGRSALTRTASASFHQDVQDHTAAGWRRLLTLIDEAAADGRTEFAPFREMSAAERRQVVTLPPTIAKLTAVTRLLLYGTNLVRIPPEIGAMADLQVFEPYTSHRLHWYPYEITRCAKLADSTVSTRALYGNFKFRPPFPALRPVTRADEADFTDLDPGVWGATAVRTCGVCVGPVDRELHQVWLSRRVGTDVLPLLVNACSADCVAALPEPERGYVPTPHTGGPDLVQPVDR